MTVPTRWGGRQRFHTDPGRDEGTPEGAFARAGRAADPELRSAKPNGGNRFRPQQHTTFFGRIPVSGADFMSHPETGNG